jgi:hypothetical protein
VLGIVFALQRNGGSAPTTTQTAAVTTAPSTAATTTIVGTTTAPPTTILSDDLRAAADAWPIRLTEPFEDATAGWFEGTQELSSGEQSYRLNRGRYLIELTGNTDGGSYFSTVDLLAGTRLDASVSVTPVDVTGDGACGLVLRMVGDRNLFVGVAAATGRGGASLFVEREISFLMADEVPLVDDGADHIEALLDGTTGYLVVNDVVVGSFTDDRLDDVIAVGIGAQFGEELTCRYDDLLVRAP